MRVRNKEMRRRWHRKEQKVKELIKALKAGEKAEKAPKTKAAPKKAAAPKAEAEKPKRAPKKKAEEAES